MQELRFEIVMTMVLGVQVLLTAYKSRQDKKNQTILLELEERRVRDAEELARRREEELKELERSQAIAEQRAKDTTEALMAIARQFIVSEHRRITDRLDGEGKPFVHIHERDSLTKLNCAYHNLGGNGLIKSLMKEIESLPVKQR